MDPGLMTWLHIQNARSFAPDDLGIAGVLCWGDRIVAVGPHVEPPQGTDVESLEAGGQILIPGLVDPHIHGRTHFDLPGAASDRRESGH